MRTKDLRNKKPVELQAMVLERKKELMNLRFQQTSSQLKNTARVREARREVAQIKTILQQQK